MARHVVGAVRDLPPGSRRLARIAGQDIVVFNVGGAFFALANRCPHQGGPLCEGRLTGLLDAAAPGQYRYSRPGEILRCPWHGWEFDIRTGQSRCEPGRIRTRSFPVEIGPGPDQPLVAQTFPVIREEEFVLIDL